MTIKRKSLFPRANTLLYFAAFTLAGGLVYYLPSIVGWLGFHGPQMLLNSAHNAFGIDLLCLVFFVPVVYAAYVFGAIPAVVAAFIAVLILLPRAVMVDDYPDTLFKPIAFFIILSAAGAAVAMLRRSESEGRQRLEEMKCLYDIGQAAGESTSIEDFLARSALIIQQARGEIHVRLTYRDRTFVTPDFQRSDHMITEELVVGGETAGDLEIHASRGNPYLKKSNHLTKTLAGRISGGIRQIELEQAQRHHYKQPEKEVEARTRDLEQVQERLIRSERLAAVGELASGVGHELRNPLNVIRNCVYLLNMALSEKGDEEAAGTLKVLDKQIDIANKIVTDLLDFTRITPPSPTRVDLKGLINECLAYLTPPENVTVSQHMNGHALFVRVDAEQTARVFTNIISNAFQAMNGQGGELDIGIGAGEGLAWASFKDTGCGVPEDNLAKIFEPLFTTKPKGIGLGLAISRRLVEHNGGKIEVSSRPGEGTTFTVNLPLEIKEETAR